MTQIFNEKLIELLKTDPRFVDDEDELIKAAVIDRAWKIDRDLVKLLIGTPEIKEKFFKEIEGHWIFNINTFIEYIGDKNFLANSYTRFRNRIGLNIDGKFMRERGEVSLVWPYKDCVLEGGQTKDEEKRKEIFFNEILAHDEINRLFDPKVLTNWKRYSADGEQKVTEIKRDENGTIRENLIIKGNNLLALHLLKKQFRGKVKLIYIDPPYNPDSAANTFSYNNNFNHSTWLTFMKNRIEIAKQMLSKDGFFCTAIDHYELFYLGVICDEVFGRDNQIGIIAVETNPGGRSDAEFFATSHEYFIIYAKDRQNAKINDIKLNDEITKYNLEDKKSKYKLVPLKRTGSNSTPDKRPNLCFPIYYDPTDKKISLDTNKDYIKIMPIGLDSVMRVWRWSKSKILSDIEDIEIKKTNGSFAVYVKDRERFEKKPKTLWYGSRYDASSHGTKLLQKFNLSEKFSYPKSLFLIKDILHILTDKNSIILDYHAGSGTTAHATIELNKEDGGERKFILAEQMDYIESVTSKRVQKVIENQEVENSFIYLELMKYNEAFMEKIQAAKTSEELIKLWKDIAENSFLNWYVNPEIPQEAVNDFIEIGKTENGLDKQKKLIAELLNKNQLYVNLSEIEDSDFAVSDEDKKLNRSFYGDI